MTIARTDSISIEIPKPDVRQLELTLIGDRRLVIHRWSEKARREMLDKQMGKARAKKSPKVPEEDFKASLYVHTDGWYGFPANGFKQSAVGACRYVEGITMVMARGCIFVEPDGEDAEGVDLVRIEGDGPHMREDMVRISMGTSDIRYRGEFRKWRANIRVRYNANIITPEQLINLFNLAGMHCGIGEGRPSAPKTTMDWGMFHVATEEEARAIPKAA